MTIFFLTKKNLYEFQIVFSFSNSILFYYGSFSLTGIWNWYRMIIKLIRFQTKSLMPSFRTSFWFLRCVCVFSGLWVGFWFLSHRPHFGILRTVWYQSIWKTLTKEKLFSTSVYRTEKNAENFHHAFRLSMLVGTLYEKRRGP